MRYIVYISDETDESGTWPRGQTVDIHFGSRNQVNAVIQTNSGL